MKLWNSLFHRGKRNENAAQAADTENRKRFHDTLSTVETMLRDAPLDAEKAEILSFAIDVLGKEFAYSVSAGFIQKGENRLQNRLFIPIPEDSPAEVSCFSLKDKAVVSPVYSLAKYRRAIVDVRTQGFFYVNDYWGQYYPELNLVIASNGLHHLSAAAVQNDGIAKLEIHPLEKAFSILHTDGAYWYQGETAVSRVCDYRLAVLYELARRRSALELPNRFKRFSSGRIEPNREYPMFDYGWQSWRYIENQFRVDLLELELEIKKYQLDLHRSVADPSQSTENISHLEKKMENIRKEFNTWTEKANAIFLRNVCHHEEEI